MGRRWARALQTWSAPALFRPGDVEALFAKLATSASAKLATAGLVGLAPFCIVGLLAGALTSSRKAIAASFELVVLVASSFFLPPLLFFSVYFCAQHSPRHLLRVSDGLSPAVIAVTGLLFTAMTVVAGGLAFLLMPDASLDERLPRTVFIGLAVLTAYPTCYWSRWRVDAVSSESHRGHCSTHGH